jgi:hypothetical protein
MKNTRQSLPELAASITRAGSNAVICGLRRLFNVQSLTGAQPFAPLRLARVTRVATARLVTARLASAQKLPAL